MDKIQPTLDLLSTIGGTGGVADAAEVAGKTRLEDSLCTFRVFEEAADLPDVSIDLNGDNDDEVHKARAETAPAVALTPGAARPRRPRAVRLGSRGRTACARAVAACLCAPPRGAAATRSEHPEPTSADVAVSGPRRAAAAGATASRQEARDWSRAASTAASSAATERPAGAGKSGRRRGERSEAAIETRRKALQFKHDLRETGNKLRDLAHIEDHPSENSSDAIEEAQKEVLGRITDLERTRQQIAESREAIERMGEQIRGASSAGVAAHGLVDTKGIGKPTTMGDDQEKFGAWNRKMENYVIGVYGESFRPVLRWAAEAERPVTIAGAQAAHDGVPELETKVNQLYAALISTTADGSESNDLVTGAPDGNGLEAWRKLHRRWDPTTGPRKRLILRSIISPPKCSADELGSALEKWIQQIGRYERRQGEDGLAELPEDIKMAALEMLVPQDIENHLVLNKHRLETFQDSLNEVMTIVEARTGVKIKAAGSLEEEPEAEVAALDMGSLDCLELASGSGRGVAAVDLSPFAQDDWMKFNWDSGAAISAFPRSFAPPTGMKGNGSTYRTASGELVPDEGSLQLKAEDEYGVLRALKGRVTNVHKPLISVGQAAGAGQCSFLGRNGGWIFHEKSPIGKRVVGMLEKEAKAAKHQMLPVYREQGVYNFYLKKGQHGSVAPLEEGLSAKSKSELVELLSGKSKEELLEILEKTDLIPRPPAASAAGAAAAGSGPSDVRPPGFQPAAAAAADALPAAPDGQQADEGEEEARPRVLKAPHEPSQREIAEHEAMGHATYRSWCRVCIAAKGQGQPHLRAPEDDETAVPVVSSDYAFMGQDDADTMPMLVLRDRRSKMMAATFVEKKGDDAYAIKFFARFLRILGYRKIVNKSDGEPAILLVKRRAVEEVPGLEAIPQESAPADHQANGEIEVTVREIKKQVRALKMDLESKLGVKVEDKHPVLAHLPEHAASVINRYRRGQDGKTALQRLTGRQWRKPVPLFGERLMARFAGERVRKNALEEQMVEARYIGHHPRDGSMMVITSDGVKKAVGFRSLPQSEKWITAGWDGLKGLPWDVAPRAASAPRAIVGPGEVGPPPIVVVSPQPQAPRRMYVLKADIERLGATPGCPGCISIARHGRVLAGHAHNAVCSKRIFEALDAEEAGRERTGQYRERRQGQEARVRPAASAAAGTPPPKTARRITEPVAAAAAASAAPAATRSAAAPAVAATAARLRESQPVAPGFGVAAPSGGASSSSGAARAAEAAADVDMTAARSRLKRSAEVAPDDVPEALERGDPQPADVPVPVDMEDLAAQPAPAEGPQLPAGVAVVWNASEGRHMRVLALDVASIELVELGVLTRAKAELLPLVREQVSGHWASAGVDIADEEVDSIALSALQLGAVDVAEVYSPHRFSARAAEFQLRPGFAADLEELKEDGAPWDLRRPEDVKELEKQQERMDPILLTGSPPCEKFSLLRGLSAKFRTDEQEAAEMEEARHHLKVAVDAYWRQLRKPGRYFLHEHPWSARSWNEDIVKELVAHPGVFTVKGPMCRWGMKLTNPRNGQEEFVRKETGWVTNHPGLARRLQGTCSNVDGRAEWHRHITLVGGIARFAKVYPPKLVEAVLEELKDTLNDVGELSTAQVQQSGPVPVDAAVPPGDWTSYWDDVNGGYLEAGLVAQARAVEREWVKKQELIEIVPRSQAFAETGRPPIPLKWIDTNKGDAERPNYRSRLVVKEIKAKKRPDEQLEASEVFSAMPPLEAMRSLVSLMVTWAREPPLHVQESLRKKGRKPGNFKIGFFDISRAHFYGKAQRRIFVELEEESRKEYGEDKRGLLLKSWYGTQDASKIWQGDYTELLEENGYKAGVSCPAVFYKEVDETRLLGHGDDFAVLAQQQDIDSFEATLGKKYEFKKTANLGFDEGDDKQAVFLNRVIEVSAGVPPGGGRPCRHAMIEPDKRHAEIVIDELGLSKANGVDTPTEKRSADKQMMDAKSAALGAAEASRFRSLTMRVAYLSQDRLDLAEASKTLARSMQTPTEASWLMLKRVGRYLKRHPSTVTVFTEQKTFDKIRVYVDSDHAGCAVTRKSTGGFVAMLGHHVVKHGSNLQSTVSLSSGESEYYALVKGGSVGLGLHSLFADWGLDLKVELASDSSAARGHVQRRGLGKMRHVQSRYLWIQERVGKGDLSIAAVPGKNNVADVLTKSVGGSLLRRHMATLNIWDRAPSSNQKDIK
ncbi:unnamed protein product [Prorocentrum cordatum]|uniref:Integrase catalytic domain-containing protein n=1 Tax=Prorocentrum cordatum TaxID=2364126 RepID=A0ABN9W8B1_9DINO|nr:unnamed protein product [Polarella glacialis]